jgi:hypothetical protein
VAEDEPRLLGRSHLQGVRADVRIAIAVAADPGAYGEERRQPGLARELEAKAQRLLQVGVETRQLGQEGEAEIGERIGDLVGDREAREPEHRGEPQPQHLGVQRAVARRALRRGEEPGDLALALEDALALHLGRMRGQHRAHASAREPADEFLD